MENTSTITEIPASSDVSPTPQSSPKQQPVTQESSSSATVVATAEEVNQLKKNYEYLKDDLEHQKGNVDRTNNFMYVVVIFVAVTFIAAVLSIYWDGILSTKSDKELYLRYNDVYKNYSDAINSQQTKISDLQQQLELLKARNSYLK